MKKPASFIIFLILLALHTIIAAWHVLGNTITFHTDIARDFLLIEDIVVNKNLALLGPRSGGITGVFHGPLWLYLNVPAFIIGQGDPVVVGWFWVLLFIISTVSVYLIGKKLWSQEAGIYAALLYSIALSTSVHVFFNTHGALLLFPTFLYFFISYLKDKSIKALIISQLLLGCLIQFQMAFGGPLLIVVGVVVVIIAIKDRSLKPLLGLMAVLIPLASFAIFELRNNFLQTRSVLAYLNGDTPTFIPDSTFIGIVRSRLQLAFLSTPGLLTYNHFYLNLLIMGVIIVACIRRNTKYIGWIATLYLGYWVLTGFYKGMIWDYYYSPFLGGLALVLGASLFALPRLLRYSIFTILYLSLLLPLLPIKGDQSTYAKDSSKWLFYKNAAESVYQSAPAEFGYYAFTTDQYAYSSRYAMSYMQHKYPVTKSYPYIKKSTTYLLIDDPGDNIVVNSRDWTRHDLKIMSFPRTMQRFSKTYKVEKYNLTAEDLAVESNPNLINTLIFR